MRISIIAILIFIFLQSVCAQQSFTFSLSDSIIAAANPKLEASGIHLFLFGSQWRDAWTTPIKAKLFRPNSTKSISTDSLASTHHNNANGCSFTPFHNDSATSLPAELSEILPKDIVADQISALNPYAPLITNTILQAVGLPYREIRIATLHQKNSPDSSYVLGLVEGVLHLSSEDIGLCADTAYETNDMLKSLVGDNQNRADEKQYLKARLVDLLLGDWDRSENDLRWHKTQLQNTTLWKPVPLAHRKAFMRLNGLLPTIADYAIPELENCGDQISSIENITLTGRFLDRRLLISYPKQTWDSLAIWIQFHLSDSVLTQALSNLPIPILEKEGEALMRLLRARRNQLPKTASEFYKLSSSFIDVRCSNQADRVEIRRIGRHMVSVLLFESNGKPQKPYYQRLFHDDFTKEIRILLLDGNDAAIVEGEENSAIKIIIDGGEGRNEFIDKSKSRSLFGTFNPFSASGAIYYDYNPESLIKTGSNTTVVRDYPKSIPSKKDRTDKSFRNWGSNWSFSPWFDINPDDGLFVGGGPMYTEYAYRTEPYAKQIGIRAGLATRTMRYRLDASGEFRDWFRGLRVQIQLHASQLDLSNFFGIGNETRYSQSLDDNGCYKVDQQQIFIHAELGYNLASNISMTIGNKIKLIDNNPKPGTLLNSLLLPYYNKSLTFMSLNTRFQLDSRDNVKAPSKGLFAAVEASYIPEILDNTNSFYKIKSELRSYASFQLTTLAFRLICEKIWGKYPFFESTFLGGNESLRGFERQRFAGDASLMGGAELRTSIIQTHFIFPLWIGFTGFAETGRVFLYGEQSIRWHNVIGGGIWFSFIKPEYAANFSLARSEDKFAFYATMGFMF